MTLSKIFIFIHVPRRGSFQITQMQHKLVMPHVEKIIKLCRPPIIVNLNFRKVLTISSFLKLFVDMVETGVCLETGDVGGCEGRLREHLCRWATAKKLHKWEDCPASSWRHNRTWERPR